MAQTQGIDVSQFQPDVDWSKIGQAVSFAFIRATYGATAADSAFSRGRVAEAQKHLGFVGFYHYASPDKGDAKDEAEHFVKTVHDRGGHLGLQKLDGIQVPNGVLDYEAARPGGGDDVWVKRWVDRYTDLTGHKPLIYGGSVLREQDVQAHGCPLWLAAYVSNPNAFIPLAWHDRGYAFWQYTESGSCPGVPGDVDRSIFRKGGV